MVAALESAAAATSLLLMALVMSGGKGHRRVGEWQQVHDEHRLRMFLAYRTAVQSHECIKAHVADSYTALPLELLAS